MKRQFLLFIFITCAVVTNVQSANQSINGTYNILNYGADTLNVCTQAINNAIESAYRNGGGKVIIPAGRFRSGTIFLKDNIEIHLSGGAILEASDDYSDFPLIPSTTYRSLKDAGGWSALIYAEKANHISITGKIWNQHYLDCEDVTVTDIRVFNHANGNNDGIDIDGCRRFILSDSVIDSDDDGIVLKSTGIAPCEDIVITNCIVSSFANAIKCGTESTGGFRNILISDCIVKPSRSEGERVIKSTPTGITAISLEVVDGGVMEGVTVNNILIEGTECPLYIRLANRGRKHISSAPIPPIGVMRNIQISNITAYGTGNFCSSITGIPERKIENIYLNNIRFVNKGGLAKGNFLTKELVEGVRHDMAKSMYPDKYWASFKDIIEDEKGYPQPTVWRNLPSYGLFIRNVETLELSNGTFTSEKPEPRNPIIAVNVDKLYLHQINAGQNSSSEVLLHKVPDIDADPSLKVRIEQ